MTVCYPGWIVHQVGFSLHDYIRDAWSTEQNCESDVKRSIRWIRNTEGLGKENNKRREGNGERRKTNNFHNSIYASLLSFTLKRNKNTPLNNRLYT